jgi:uncharacterized ubiquitin-like protein YukD
MIRFEQEYFKKFNFSPKDIDRYLENAFHDLEIARKDPFSEVRFSYSFQALIKAGIALIAKTGRVKVLSIPGHHIKILTKTSEILGDPDILTIGNAMRMKRNTDLYGGGQFIAKKEAADYFEFVENTLDKVTKTIKRETK